MRRNGTFFLAIAAAIAVSTGCGDDDEPLPSAPPDGPATFNVMTQNLFLGGDLELLLAPGADLPQVVEQIWGTVQATDFNARAKVIADTIQASNADLVGLQEAALWRTQAPGDRLPIPNATAVAYDFIDILVRELAARGLDYSVVGSVANGDVEVTGASGTDYRITDRDAILARTSLPVTSSTSGIYPHLAVVEVSPVVPGGPPIRVTIPRGWVAADFRAGGKTMRFFNTHLEAFSAEVAGQQAQDLVDLAKAAQLPAIVAGDMNLPPGSAGYGTFVAPATGLVDSWTALKGSDPGLTCCWRADLKSGAYTTRIDLVFHAPDVLPTSALKVNETERTPAGLAPSDHAGVVVGFTTRAPAVPAALTASPARLPAE
jgi:endonuclease/exonuclease/phosphatase family metal-dependent hydrolase